MPTQTYYALGTKTMANSSTSTITFSSIPQNYQHLVVISSHASTHSGNVDMAIRFNSDSAGNYNYRYLYYNTTSPYYGHSSTGTQIADAVYTGWTNGSPPTSANIHLMIFNYTNTSFWKHYLYESTHTHKDLSTGIHGGGMWRNLNAITSISLAHSTGNFQEGSTVTLYGITGGS